eukprot:3465215-Pyramimonas_sp.AAC.1
MVIAPACLALNCVASTIVIAFSLDLFLSPPPAPGVGAAVSPICNGCLYDKQLPLSSLRA